MPSVHEKLFHGRAVHRLQVESTVVKKQKQGSRFLFCNKSLLLFEEQLNSFRAELLENTRTRHDFVKSLGHRRRGGECYAKVESFAKLVHDIDQAFAFPASSPSYCAKRPMGREVLWKIVLCDWKGLHHSLKVAFREEKQSIGWVEGWRLGGWEVGRLGLGFTFVRTKKIEVGFVIIFLN